MYRTGDVVVSVTMANAEYALLRRKLPTSLTFEVRRQNDDALMMAWTLDDIDPISITHIEHMNAAQEKFGF